MVFLFFTCQTSAGNCQYYSVGGDDMESCFDALAELIHLGYVPLTVKLSVSPNSMIGLPVEAFDDKPMSKPIRELQREWEAVLFLNH